jgi:hypothetical protein
MVAMQRKDRVRHTLQLGLQSTMGAIYQQLGSLLISPMLQYQGKEYTGRGHRCSITDKHIIYTFFNSMEIVRHVSMKKMKQESLDQLNDYVIFFRYMFSAFSTSLLDSTVTRSTDQ